MGIGNFTISILQPDEAELLSKVADGVFDKPVRPDLVGEFLEDPRHHLAVALRDGKVVGFASAVHYVHPDKPSELWINEIGVAPPCQSQGVGKELMRALLRHGKLLGCSEAWVLADEDNSRARQFYKSLGGSESPAVMYSFDISKGS